MELKSCGAWANSTLTCPLKVYKVVSSLTNYHRRDNLVRLKIYYPDLIHETEVHKETYKFESFLGGCISQNY